LVRRLPGFSLCKVVDLRYRLAVRFVLPDVAADESSLPGIN
jgi:hypothetical protein